jgi:hypothetical protein
VAPVVPAEVPDVLDELDAVELDEGVELDVAEGAELDAGAEFAAAGVVEVWVDWDCVDPWEPASGSVYCWSPADGPWASPVAGTNSAAARATIRQTSSLRGICGGEVLHSAQWREPYRPVSLRAAPKKLTTCLIPLGRLVLRIVYGSRPGTNVIRSRAALARELAGSDPWPV